VEQHQQTDPLPKGAVDPDVDLHVDRPRRRTEGAAILTVIAVGGATGASARYLAALAWPTQPGGFPWSTLVVNVIGCGLIGILMVLVTDVLTRQRLIRPFLGTGVLGGFTTFSAFSLDAALLMERHNYVLAAAYVAGSVVAAIMALFLGLSLFRSAGHLP
jgi:CrcB protein